MALKLFSSDTTVVHTAVQFYRKFLSQEPQPPLDAVVSRGLVPRLVELLSHDTDAIVFEAAWAVTNIASGSSTQTETVVKAGAVPILINLISSPTSEIQEQAVWALGNVAGDDPVFRDFLIQNGVIQPLVNAVAEDSDRVSLLRHTSWLISNLCRGKDPPPDFEKVRELLPALVRTVFSIDEDVITDTCWALSYLSDGTDDKIEAVLNSGIARRITELLMHPSSQVCKAALRTVGNIITGNDIQTQMMLNCSVLPCLSHLLNSPTEAIRKEACWTVSNITAGNKAQIQAVIDCEIVPTLVSILGKADFTTRKEAAWAITNGAAGGTPEQVRTLVRCDSIRHLCDLLTVNDPKVVQVALKGIEHILRAGEQDKDNSEDGRNPYAIIVEECYGLDKIEFLQQNENDEIYKKAFNVIDKYFPQDQVEDNGFVDDPSGTTPFMFTAPSQLNQQFNFSS